MKFLLLILIVFPLVNSQAARTLTEGYNRKPQKAPPPPFSAPPSGVVIPLLASYVHHRGASPPPPPKSATPVIELIQNYGRKGKLPPPAPKVAPPTHQVSGGGVAAFRQALTNTLLSSV